MTAVGVTPRAAEKPGAAKLLALAPLRMSHKNVSSFCGSPVREGAELGRELFFYVIPSEARNLPGGR